MNARNKYISVGLASVVIAAMLIGGCQNGCNHPAPPPLHKDTAAANMPVQGTPLPFNADSAYKYTSEQVGFGPRIPGTKAHEKCLQFIVALLKADSLNVTIQKSSAKTFDGKTFEFENVIASSQPNNQRRLLLCTHWDTRPFADLDTANKMKPFDGADDGASGVAMLLEIGRHLKNAKLSIGVDLVFFDIEDYGQQEGIDGNYPEMDDSWCLGSQYWAKNIAPNYAPMFGILLDMVGGKNAVFPEEGTSMHFAPDIVKKVWDIAAKAGYGAYFTHDITTMTTDDHMYVNKIANIPTIDIVHYDMGHNDYPYFHHKHSDNMSVIDTSTMHMVGNVLMDVIEQE